MTKAVKVFRGSVSADSTTTVYTVPAGRVAKVTFSYLRNFGGTGTVELLAGGVTFFSVTASASGQGFPIIYAQTATNEAVLASSDAIIGGSFTAANQALSTSSSNLRAIPKEVYLIANDTVQVRYANYSFSVVEEY
jgi:hypothetical protein